MSLFNLFGGSGDTHQQTTTSTSQVTNTQLAGGNIGGAAIYGSGNVVTDQGALIAAADISQAALSLGKSAVDANVSVSTAALDNGYNVTASALDKVARFSAAALDSNAVVTGKAVDAVQGLAAQVSQSSTQSGNDTVTKLALYAALAVVAIMVLRK